MPSHETSRRPRSIRNMLVLIALAIAAGRIAVVTSKEGDTAFLSANDRSRWCTVAALVEHGTYAIDEQIEIADAIKRHHHPWGTIDKVRHLGRDGKQHHYSSKPPLFPTMVAGVYLVVNLMSGMTLTDQPIYVTRIVLALVNLPLLAIFLLATIRSIERVCHRPWARRMATLSACFGTMMLPFSISLNNHLPAAAATAVAMWIYLRAVGSSEDAVTGHSPAASFLIWLIAGASAAFAAANELPALSMLVFWFILFAWLDRSSILPQLVGVGIVALGFFGTNWIAHQSFRPPYAHRGNGELIATLDSVAEQPGSEIADEIDKLLREKSLISGRAPLAIEISDEPQRWVVEAGEQRFGLLRVDGGWQLRHWDDWYEYPGTYWKEGVRAGVDQGEPSRLVYFAQMTFGHHGIFSLTAIWLLVPIGLVRGLVVGPAASRRYALAVLVASTVCLLFYAARPLVDRNYGGVSVCFRWMLWFAPLWLVAIAPVMESFRRSATRRNLLQGLLALSVFSMATALQSPWQSPWLYRFWQFLGWIEL